MGSLEGTSWGKQVSGSTEIQSTNDQQTTQQKMNQSMTESVQSVSKSIEIQADQDPSKFSKILMNEPSQPVKVRSHTAKRSKSCLPVKCRN